jgi:O-antigen/teichoic acid export membrane protein
MGIIAKQTLRGSALTYAGIGFGFLTAGYLFPNFLSKEQVGVLNLLLKLALFFSFFSNLGFNTITLKLFPFYRDPENNHNGFFSLKILVNALGFALFCASYYFLEPIIIKQNLEKSKILIDYLYLLTPLVAIYMIFGALDTYNRVLYNAVQGTFLRDFIQRLVILVFFGFFLVGILNFQGFINAYVIAMVVPVLGLIYFLAKRKELKVSFRSINLTKSQKTEMISVGAFGLFSGIAPILVSTLDTVMVFQYLGPDQTGVYATMIFFSTVIIAPSKALVRIGTPVVADAWKENDIIKIDELHKRSGINQLLFSGLVFIGIWANMDNLFVLIPEYEEGKYVVFYLGLASLANMALGMNQVILSTSPRYKYQTLFVIILSVSIVISNMIFIPRYGIVGAAIATLVATVIVNIAKWFFVYVRLKTQPFTLKTVVLILIFLATYFIQDVIPKMYFIIDLTIRSFIITVIFIGTCYALKVSEDLNRQIDKVLKMFTK